MQLFTTISSLQEALKMLSKSQTVGFVPTMGALHEGHLSLVRIAKKNTDKVVISIFVNPTQFDRKEDLINYPSTIKEDIRLLQKEKCDFLFVPNVEEMYRDTIESQKFDFDDLDIVMEGAHRKGHFDGVGTIVKRLFEIVNPAAAFFGEKDFQQLQIIRKLVAKEKMDINIVGCPIYREADGLAMSSRNTRLTASYRKDAPFINKTLREAKKLFDIENANEMIDWVKNAFENHPSLKLEYFTIANEANLLSIEENRIKKTKVENSDERYRAFIAVFAGDIRLIDNIALD